MKTVNLPGDAGKLLEQDLEYIVGQIQALNEPMSAEQQADFLPSANEPSQAS